MPTGVGAGLALDRHRLLGEDRGCMEQRTMMLAAIEAVAKADAIRTPLATTRTSPHRQPPVNWSMVLLLSSFFAPALLIGFIERIIAA